MNNSKTELTDTWGKLTCFDIFSIGHMCTHTHKYTHINTHMHTHERKRGAGRGEIERERKERKRERGEREKSTEVAAFGRTSGRRGWWSIYWK